MRIHKQFFKSIALATLFSTGFAAYGIAQDTTTIVDPEIKAPVILATSPSGGEMNVGLGSVIEITFSNDMDEKSINGTTLLLYETYADSMHQEHSEVMMENQINDQSVIKHSEKSWQYTTGAINGTISYSNKVAVFTPNEQLKEDALYTFTVTIGVESWEHVALENDQKWSFTTISTSDQSYSDKQNDINRFGMGETEDGAMQTSSTNKTEMIDLGKAGHYVILAKKDVNNESGSKIKGHIGEGSLAKSIKREKVEQQSTSGQNLVTPSNQSETALPDVIEAIKDMMTAYADAALQYGDDLTSHKNEGFNSAVLTPGVHEWSDSLHIASDITLSGSANDVWLFKTGKNLTVQENTVFTLTNGARADHVFWYVEGEVIIGKNAHFEGIILSTNEITLDKGAKLNGRMFSQRSITLDENTITEPRSMAGQTSSTNK